MHTKTYCFRGSSELSNPFVALCTMYLPFLSTPFMILFRYVYNIVQILFTLTTHEQLQYLSIHCYIYIIFAKEESIENMSFLLLDFVIFFQISNYKLRLIFTEGDFLEFFSMHCIQHYFICRLSDSTVSEDAGIEPRTVSTSVLTVRRLTSWLDLILSFARSHPCN